MFYISAYKVLGCTKHLMTWFRDRVISTSDRLLRAMLSAMRAPMQSNPFHCFCSVALCWLLKGSIIMNGASKMKLNSMCVTVINRGKEKPAKAESGV